MKQKIWKAVCLSGAVLSGGWLAFYGALMLWARRTLETEAASIGVIGGADGPTAIFVRTSGIDWDLVIVGAVLVVSVIGYLRLCKQKKQ